MRADPFRRRARHAPVDGVLADLLQARVERRVDLEAALERPLRAELLLQLVVDVRGEIRILEREQPTRALADQMQRRTLLGRGLRGGDEAARDHAVEHVFLPQLGAPDVDVR